MQLMWRPVSGFDVSSEILLKVNGQRFALGSTAGLGPFVRLGNTSLVILYGLLKLLYLPATSRISCQKETILTCLLKHFSARL